MASKRYVRTFHEEGNSTSEKQHRQSRPTKQDEGPRERRRESTSSSTDSRQSNMAGDQVLGVALGGEQVVVVAAVEAKTAESISSGSSSGGRDARHARTSPPPIGDSPVAVSFPSLYTSPTTKYQLPTEGRPHNFGVVVPGVYRSSYPTMDDFVFMKELGLKTIVTLGRKDEPDETYADFMAANSIRHHIIDMKGTKKENIPIHTMKNILRIVLDQQHYPLMIHCNHGKHRTGCVVAVVRKLSGWKLTTIVDEYKTYAEPKVRECDVEYITTFELSQLSNLFVHEASMRVRSRLAYRVLLFSFVVLVLWSISSRQMTYTTRPARVLT